MREKWRDRGLFIIFIGFLIAVIGLSIMLFFGLEIGWNLVYLGIGIELQE